MQKFARRKKSWASRRRRRWYARCLQAQQQEAVLEVIEVEVNGVRQRSGVLIKKRSYIFAQSKGHILLNLQYNDILTPNKDQENNRDAKRQPFGVKDINNNRAYETEESSSGVF
ncbi:hypothetical protein VPH35_013503 [Triticum aestivum]|uniref:Uncharacterized protein n=1 Tax=Aegilops tauschii TaxID=37682 RepID=M8BRX7_AEGTA